MRTIITAAASVIAVTALAPSAAQAKDYAKRASCSTKLERKYQARYKEVRQRHGTRAPGRNIGDHGVVRRNQTVRDARCREVAQSARQLRTLLTVPKVPQLATRAVQPAQMPSGVQSAETRVAPNSHLAAIAQCESGGNYGTNTGNGFFGAYQFTLSTWASVGGSGNPAAASPAEQDKRAAMLYAREGAAPWPVCGA